MNRPVRTRMQGGVGRAGEKLALTRLYFYHMFCDEATIAVVLKKKGSKDVKNSLAQSSTRFLNSPTLKTITAFDA